MSSKCSFSFMTMTSIVFTCKRDGCKSIIEIVETENVRSVP